MNDPNRTEANEMRTAVQLALTLARSPQTDLSRSMRSLMEPSAGLLAASKAASEAMRSAAKVFDSLSLQKSIFPAFVGLQTEGVLADLGKQMATIGRLSPPPSALLDGFSTSAFKSLLDTQRLIDTRVTGQMLGIQDSIRAITEQQNDWIRDLGSKFLAGLTFPKIDIRDWLPAIHFPPPPESGTLMGDLLIVDWERSTEEEKLAALDRLVARIPWRAEGDVSLALTFRSVLEKRSRAKVAKDVLQTGLLLALGEQDRPQKHRFGRHWFIDDDGHTATFVPNDLPVDLFWRWLADEARTAAGRILLERPYPGAAATYEHDNPLLPTQWPQPEHTVNPEQQLVRRDEMLLVTFALGNLLEKATPAQQRLVIALAIELRSKPGATFADAAERLGISPSTARVQRRQLFERLGLDRQPTLYAYLATLEEARRLPPGMPG